ncbi:MAG: DUF4255 domain-containing protein [Phormidesmis sp. RL_2_1]|nr:DUF4255 domain-containing protein [Phormidesmis sp. RL_2_1]
MANVWAIHSVGDSLVTYLRNSYNTFIDQNAPDDSSLPNPVPECRFSLLSSPAFDDMESALEGEHQLSLYLYRINVNEHLRNLRQGGDFPQKQVPLSLDLHYLMTVWSKSALAEQLIIAWAMRQMQATPVLDRSYLSAQANWGTEEMVQIIPAELTHEDMMRIWDALKPAYRLSFGYVARVVRIESDVVETGLPVVATRFGLGVANGATETVEPRLGVLP